MNASDKIALVSVASSGAVGLAGVLAAGLGGWRDRRAARERADTERKQTRLAEAYVDLLDFCERIGNWVVRLQPIVTTVDYQPPSPPPEAEQARVAAKLAAYGSAEVKALHKTWRDAVNEIVRADQMVRLRLQAREEHKGYVPKPGEDISWRDPGEPLLAIHQVHLPAEVKAREALTEQVAKELA